MPPLALVLAAFLRGTDEEAVGGVFGRNAWKFRKRRQHVGKLRELATVRDESDADEV